MKQGLTAAILLLALALPASAHRLDESLQATTISLERNRISALVRLTPGVEIFPALLKSIDTNSDGVTRARNDKPPMPWPSLHAMSDLDLRAIYQFIKSLGKAGSPMPADLPPGQEPKTPFLVFAPPTPPAADGK